MNTFLGFLIALGLLLVIFGGYWLFSAKEPVRGIIVEKHHKPASKSRGFIMIGVVPVQQTYTHPEAWVLIVSCPQHEVVEVSKEEWDKYNIGDNYG